MRNPAHRMIHLLVLAGLFAIGSYPMQGTVNQPPSPSAPQSIAASEILLEEAVCRAGDPAELGAPSAPWATEAAACSRCPIGTPQCFRDRDCDSFCGGKTLGACVRINSCYKCCSCAA